MELSLFDINNFKSIDILRIYVKPTNKLFVGTVVTLYKRNALPVIISFNLNG